MTFEYGLNKEVVTSWVYNVFNSGMGVYDSYYEYIIEFIMNEWNPNYDKPLSDFTFFSHDYYDLFCDIEYDFTQYCLDNSEYDTLYLYYTEYYGNIGYDGEEILDEFECKTDLNRDENIFRTLLVNGGWL